MATAITTTGQDITGDFDLVARGSSTTSYAAVLLKSLGTGSTNWVYHADVQIGGAAVFVKNTGTNAFKLAAAISGVTVEFQQ